MHFFSTAFLVAMAEKLKQQGQYHVAKKKIPSKDGPVQARSLNITHIVAWLLYLLTYSILYLQYQGFFVELAL